MYATVLGVAAGAMLTALSGAEPGRDLSRGAAGLFAATRFGLAILLASALTP